MVRNRLDHITFIGDVVILVMRIKIQNHQHTAGRQSIDQALCDDREILKVMETKPDGGEVEIEELGVADAVRRTSGIEEIGVEGLGV